MIRELSLSNNNLNGVVITKSENVCRTSEQNNIDINDLMTQHANIVNLFNNINQKKINHKNKDIRDKLELRLSKCTKSMYKIISSNINYEGDVDTKNTFKQELDDLHKNIEAFIKTL